MTIRSCLFLFLFYTIIPVVCKSFIGKHHFNKKYILTDPFVQTKCILTQEDFLNCLLTKFHQNHSLIIQVLSIGYYAFPVIQRIDMFVPLAGNKNSVERIRSLPAEDEHREAAWARRGRRPRFRGQRCPASKGCS